MKTKPDQMYAVTDGGQMLPVDKEGEIPDAVICRRLTDYGSHPLPRGGSPAVCVRCGVDVWTHAHVYPGIPRECMQCAGIEPLPL